MRQPNGTLCAGHPVPPQGYLSSGAFFGELAVFSETKSEQRRPRTCRAVTDCQLCFIRREDMETLRENCPASPCRVGRCRPLAFQILRDGSAARLRS